MKTCFTNLALLAGFSASVFAQGQVTLGNNSSSLIRIGDPINGPPIPVGSMLFQLYVGTAGTPEGSLTPLLPIAATSSITEGRIRNTVIDVYPQFAVGYPGRLLTFQIWGWSSSFTTYAEAANGGGLVGKSILFVAQTSPDSPNPFLPTPLAGLYPGFAVNPIPEPSTWALLALGGTALWWVLCPKSQRRWRVCPGRRATSK